MSQGFNNIIENYSKMKIGADEPFKFRCTMCGKCCIEREDILLNPKDLYNISKELGLKPGEAVKKYCDTYVGNSSRIPIVRLKPQGPTKRCPLLNGNRCLVHKVKPTVCAMFPIGRGIPVKAEDELDSTDASKIEYIFVNPGCGDNRDVHTPREWLREFGIPLDDQYFLKWHQTIASLAKDINKLEEKCNKSAMDPIWNVTFGILYLNYDLETEFMPQFVSNSEKIVRIIKELVGAISA